MEHLDKVENILHVDHIFEVEDIQETMIVHENLVEHDRFSLTSCPCFVSVLNMTFRPVRILFSNVGVVGWNV